MSLRRQTKTPSTNTNNRKQLNALLLSTNAMHIDAPKRGRGGYAESYWKITLQAVYNKPGKPHGLSVTIMYEPVSSDAAKQAKRTLNNSIEAFAALFEEMQDYLYYDANNNFQVSSDPFKVMDKDPNMVAPFRFKTTTPDEMLERLQLQFYVMLKKRLRTVKSLQHFWLCVRHNFCSLYLIFMIHSKSTTHCGHSKQLRSVKLDACARRRAFGGASQRSIAKLWKLHFEIVVVVAGAGCHFRQRADALQCAVPSRAQRRTTPHNIGLVVVANRVRYVVDAIERSGWHGGVRSAHPASPGYDGHCHSAYQEQRQDRQLCRGANHFAKLGKCQAHGVHGGFEHERRRQVGVRVHAGGAHFRRASRIAALTKFDEFDVFRALCLHHGERF